MDAVEDTEASCNPRVILMRTFNRALKPGGDAGLTKWEGKVVARGKALVLDRYITFSTAKGSGEGICRVAV